MRKQKKTEHEAGQKENTCNMDQKKCEAMN